jgi:hypothetical protein
MFATSTLLLPMSKLGMSNETMPLLRSVEMGVEILEAMDESVVARKSVEIIRQYIRDFKASGTTQPPAGAEGDQIPVSAEAGHGQGFEVPVCFTTINISPLLMNCLSNHEIGMGLRFRFPRLLFRGHCSSIRRYWRTTDVRWVILSVQKTFAIAILHGSHRYTISL